MEGSDFQLQVPLVASVPNIEILKLFFDNPQALIDALATMTPKDQNLISDYILEMVEIIEGLRQEGQEETERTGQICTQAARTIMNYAVRRRRSRRDKFISTMEIYLNELAQNTSKTRQFLRDLGTSAAIAGGTLSTFWGINMWNFWQCMSALSAIAGANPGTTTAMTAMMGFNFIEYSVTDYLYYIILSRDRPDSFDEVARNFENSVYNSYFYSIINYHYDDFMVF
jgi:hypothetical protein